MRGCARLQEQDVDWLCIFSPQHWKQTRKELNQSEHCRGAAHLSRATDTQQYAFKLAVSSTSGPCEGVYEAVCEEKLCRREPESLIILQTGDRNTCREVYVWFHRQEMIYFQDSRTVRQNQGAIHGVSMNWGHMMLPQCSHQTPF